MYHACAWRITLCLFNVLSACVVECLQVMDSGSFTDLLSAAMSESGLIDLETSNDQPVVGVGSYYIGNSQPVVGRPASQQIVSVPVQPPLLRSNSIIVQRPQFHSPALSLRPVAIRSSADTQRGVRKIVIRPMPAGLPKSMPPVVLQSTSNRQPLIRTSAGQTLSDVVRPVLPSLRSTASHTGVNTIIAPRTAAHVAAIRPTLNAGTLRITAIPRQFAARLPTGETNVSVQIRPRMPASTIIPQTASPLTGSIIQPVGQTVSGRPTLIEASVPLTSSNLVPLFSSSLSTTALLPSTTETSAGPPTAVSPARSVSSVAGSVVAASCASSVPVMTSMPNTASCGTAGSAGVLVRTEASSSSELSLKNSNVSSHIDSSSAVVSSSAVESARYVSATTTMTVSAASVDRCSPVICGATLHTSASLEQPGVVSRTLTSSQNFSVTDVDSEAEHVAAETKSTCTTEAEADNEQVR